ncbi:MAG: peptidoglycan endopeptidase, partial [Bacilli bacterium]|nr:peptidoglycan endopeptidase [Bacilli bacterium]
MPSAYADTSHLVGSGDTLWGIAQTFHTSVPALKQQNGLKSDLIYPGQTVNVSADQSSSSASPLSQVSGQASTYTVKAGDTLWQLAQDHHTSVQTLESLNGLLMDTIYVGQVLQISDNAPASQQLDTTDPQLPDVPS